MVQLSHAVLLYKAHNIHRDERITFVTAPVLDPLSHLNTKLLVRCVGFSNGRAKESFPSHQLQNALRVVQHWCKCQDDATLNIFRSKDF